jgi:hypothetical protein
MIIYKCDICKKQVNNIESIVLYKTKLDYCESCKTKANKIKKAMANSIEYYNSEANKQISEAEQNIIRRYTDENT